MLLEIYLSDSSVGAYEDSGQEVDADMASCPKASSATKPGRKTRVTTLKQSSSRAATKVEAARTAKLEAGKRKRKVSPLSTIPTLASEEVEEEDEGTDILLVVDNRAAPRLPSPATKRQRQLE
jgi:hypothetical protein